MAPVHVTVSIFLSLVVWCAPLLKSEAQEMRYRADSAKVARAAEAGARLVHWVETVPDAGQHIIYARNISERPVRVTSYEVYNCVGLRGRACGIHSPGPLIQPGKTVRLMVISFRGPQGSYQYRVSSAFADSTAADTTKH